LDDKPTARPGREPRKSAPRTSIAAAQGHNLDVPEPAQYGRGSPDEIARALSATRDNDKEAVRSGAERAPQIQALGQLDRPGGERRGNRQPEVDEAVGVDAATQATGQHGRRRDDYVVDFRASPGEVRDHQIGDHGHNRHGRRRLAVRPNRRPHGHRVEAHDDRWPLGANRRGNHPVDRPEQRPLARAEGAPAVRRMVDGAPDPGRQADRGAVQSWNPPEPGWCSRVSERITDDRLEPAWVRSFERLAHRGRGAAVPPTGVGYEE
jgi:hypothetical protein